MIAGPPDPYELFGVIQTVYCYHFSAHSDSWALATECHPFALKVPAMMEVLQPFAAATWASVPLALRFANEKRYTEDLRLTSAAPSARPPSPCGHWHAPLPNRHRQPRAALPLELHQPTDTPASGVACPLGGRALPPLSAWDADSAIFASPC